MKRLATTIIIFTVAAVLAPVRLGLRGPMTVSARATSEGTITTVRHDQRVLLASDDSKPPPAQNLTKTSDQADDRDDAAQVVNDPNADGKGKDHKNHHRHHHSDDDDQGADFGAPAKNH